MGVENNLLYFLSSPITIKTSGLRRYLTVAPEHVIPTEKSRGDVKGHADSSFHVLRMRYLGKRSPASIFRYYHAGLYNARI